MPDNSGLKFVENGRYTDEKSVICGVIHLAWAFFGHIEYSGQHDRTAYWVQDGDVDAGVVNSEIINKMFADGRLRDGDIRILSTTPPFPDYVWAAHPRVSAENRSRIQQAFLELSIDNPRHQVILSNLGTARFYPASVEDFSTLFEVMRGRRRVF